MHCQNSLLPNEQQMAAFADTDHDVPIYRVNLFKFKTKAQYADGRPTDLAGRQAMMNMMMSPEMQDIAVHRAAGLEGQLNIESINAAGLWLKDT